MNTIAKLQTVTARLRDPQSGCPWHLEQSFSSISAHTLAEVYELTNAIERNDMDNLRDELGDLLFHIIYYTQLASEAGYFNFTDVVSGIVNKLEHRHPHVFGNETISNAAEQSLRWTELKKQEQSSGNSHADTGLLDNVGEYLPALIRAQKLQERAAMVGFDWDKTEVVLDKVSEEITELRSELEFESDPAKVRSELGDILFSVVNLARHLHIEAELALRESNNKFKRRFHHIETTLQKQGIALDSVTLTELDKLWDEAKKNGV